MTGTDAAGKTNPVISLFVSKNKIVMILAFLASIVIPISLERLGNLSTLLDSSITCWVTALRTTTTDTVGYTSQLIRPGVERTIGFFVNMIDFYFQVLTFNFAVLSQAGLILIAIYLLIPLMVIYGIIKVVQSVKVTKDAGEPLTELLPSFVVLSAGFLAVLLLLLPIPVEFTWVGALLAILLLIFYLFTYIRDECQIRKGISTIEALPWKKTCAIILALVILVLTILEAALGTTYSMTSFTGLSPDIIIITVMALIAIMIIAWVFLQAKFTGVPVLEIVKLKYQENNSIKRIMTIIIYLILAIPIFDALFIRNTGSELVFIAINVPWIIVLIFHDPFYFVEIAVTAIRDAFESIVAAAREITIGLIPTTPTNVSIIGSIQPTIFNTLILFSIFVAVITVLLVIIDRRNIIGEIGEKPQKTVIFQYINYCKTVFLKYMNYWTIIVIALIIAVVVAVFEPSNYEALFGDKYVINTDPFAPIVLSAIFLAVTGIVAAVVIWGILQVKKGRSWRIVSSTMVINSAVAIIAFVMITPFIWMLKNSVQNNYQNTKDFQQQGLLPDPFTTANYAQLFGLFPPPYATLEYRVVTWMFNSLVAAVMVTGFLVIFSAMAGYCLAKRDFIGKKIIFALTIGILMVPPYVQVIPLYMELNRMGFVGSLLGVIFPFLIQPFSVFLCAEFMRSIPDDYLNAARIDGYSELAIFRKIVLPLSLPVISVMIVINFIGNWNSFMWPLLLLDQSSAAPMLRTLPLGMYQINSQLEETMGVILALATIIVVPIFVILLLAQDYIKRGVTVEGLKG